MIMLLFSDGKKNGESQVRWLLSFFKTKSSTGTRGAVGCRGGESLKRGR